MAEQAQCNCCVEDCKIPIFFEPEELVRLVRLNSYGRGPSFQCALGHRQSFHTAAAAYWAKWLQTNYPELMGLKKRKSKSKAEEEANRAVKEAVERVQPVEPTATEREAALKKVLARIDDYLACRGEFAPEPEKK